MFKKLAIGLGSVIVIAAIVICAVPLKTVSYTVNVPYESTETYYVEEPYTVSEPYQIQVEKNLAYRIIDAHAQNDLDLVLGAVVLAYVTLDNVDTVPGTFVVSFSFTTLRRNFSDIDRVYIVPGEEKIARGQADISVGEDWEWNYSITPGTKMVTETRYRDVIKYRDVERQRTITKYRQETRYKDVTILEYLISH